MAAAQTSHSAYGYYSNAGLRYPVNTSFVAANPSPVFIQAPSEKGAAGFAIDFLMGAVSAAVSKSAAAPIERAKLLIQNQDEMIKSGQLSDPYKGIGDCFGRTIKDEGFVSLWRGNTMRIQYLPATSTNRLTAKARSLTFSELGQLLRRLVDPEPDLGRPLVELRLDRHRRSRRLRFGTAVTAAARRVGERLLEPLGHVLELEHPVPASALSKYLDKPVRKNIPKSGRIGPSAEK
ncbi:hypothetical protein RJ639_039385 [Escallonia herrerae]|uniref:ADP/ATP translocase n=1 Tax=Escallonia herrerae TaxID=1293975 RepID=A0AA89B3G2_9ASTE|nr:hypothetical protein RJ639_039385 [Escallonia herrerae]